MYDFTAKFFLFPALLYFFSGIFPGIEFTSIWQPLVLGVILAGIGTVSDIQLLNNIKNPLSTLLDGGVTLLTLWVAGLIIPGAQITLLGALLFAIVIAVFEYVTHRWLLKHHG